MRGTKLFRFRLHTLLVLILGIAIGFALNLQTLRLLLGPNYAARLPPYVVEPPDILQIEVTGAFTEKFPNATKNCLVGPDGRIHLGEFGSLYVAGMKIEEARVAVRQLLEKHVAVDSVIVNVLASNSKLYYVIEVGTGSQDKVTRLPISGNETVLDAIANVGGISQVSNTKLWISRPASNGVGGSQILPVSWEQIVEGSSTATNYQLLPKDRLFISQKPLNMQK